MPAAIEFTLFQTEAPIFAIVCMSAGVCMHVGVCMHQKHSAQISMTFLYSNKVKQSNVKLKKIEVTSRERNHLNCYEKEAK